MLTKLNTLFATFSIHAPLLFRAETLCYINQFKRFVWTFGTDIDTDSKTETVLWEPLITMMNFNCLLLAFFLSASFLIYGNEAALVWIPSPTAPSGKRSLYRKFNRVSPKLSVRQTSDLKTVFWYLFLFHVMMYFCVFLLFNRFNWNQKIMTARHLRIKVSPSDETTSRYQLEPTKRLPPSSSTRSLPRLDQGQLDSHCYTIITY